MLIVLVLALLFHRPVAPEPDIYSAWTDTGYHLMISDNGTPDDPEDDWVVDWEDNRDFRIIVND